MPRLIAQHPRMTRPHSPSHPQRPAQEPQVGRTEVWSLAPRRKWPERQVRWLVVLQVGQSANDSGSDSVIGDGQRGHSCGPAAVEGSDSTKDV